MKKLIKWIKDYGYAYRFTAIVVAAVLVFAVSLIVHYASIVNPDYVAVVVTEDETLLTMQADAINTQLEQYGDDLNGDGRVKVELLYVTLADIDTNPNAYAAYQTMLATEISGERWGLVAFDEKAYRHMTELELLKAEDYQNEAGELNAWKWKGSRFYHEVNDISQIRTDLYFAARVAPEGASEKVRAAAENGKTLLERISAE